MGCFVWSIIIICAVVEVLILLAGIKGGSLFLFGIGGILLVVIILLMKWWWGTKIDYCDWCGKPSHISVSNYYKYGRGKINREPLFCSLKCMRSFESSEGVKEKRIRLINDGE
jgi:hypothetical protein